MSNQSPMMKVSAKLLATGLFEVFYSSSYYTLRLNNTDLFLNLFPATSEAKVKKTWLFRNDYLLFEEVLNTIPDEMKEKLLFHLDLFI